MFILELLVIIIIVISFDIFDRAASDTRIKLFFTPWLYICDQSAVCVVCRNSKIRRFLIKTHSTLNDRSVNATFGCKLSNVSTEDFVSHIH